ncbi:hypothetical protein OGATHE_006796 [Ogataea polymorpha]|uniref:Uncharacterized protein n=1 Tax=Ogataea polymorpha TaxID=460523 RepID=A0A9P8NSM3_9ASCO|nr:hypothetical protein OGATHE_006796 [Ogataea polymorpha]
MYSANVKVPKLDQSKSHARAADQSSSSAGVCDLGEPKILSSCKQRSGFGSGAATFATSSNSSFIFSKSEMLDNVTLFLDAASSIRLVRCKKS